MTKRVLFVMIVAVCMLASTSWGQQKHIVVLGSSTAAGMNASVYDSSWVGRLQAFYRKNTSPGDPDTLVTNLAVGGFTTYRIMPAPSTTYTTPNGYPLPDLTHNVTYALNLVPSPDIIIINMPSNDVDWGFPNYQIMGNFRLLFQEITSAGKKCYITTSQPRNYNLPTDYFKRDSLKQLADSIKINFGYWAIDFWSVSVSSDGQNWIDPAVSSGDGTHVNDLGHRYFFQQVIAKELFPANSPLPLKLISFEAAAANRTSILKWSTSEEEADTRFELEKSSNNRDFSKAATIPASGNPGHHNYSWTDDQPFNGKTWYRLKIVEPSRTIYSKIVTVDQKIRSFAISSLHLDGSNLYFRLSSLSSGAAEVTVFSISGAKVKTQKLTLTNNTQYSVSVNDLAPGEYVLQIADNKANQVTERFVKLK